MAQWVRISLQCRRLKRHGFNPWVGKIPWSRKWQPTPVGFQNSSGILLGKFHGQRSLIGYSLWGWKEWNTIEWEHNNSIKPTLGSRWQMCEFVEKIDWGDGRSHSDKGVWPPILLESSITWIILKCYKFNREDILKRKCAEGLSSPESKMLMATCRMTSISKRHCSWEQWGWRFVGGGMSWKAFMQISAFWETHPTKPNLVILGLRRGQLLKSKMGASSMEQKSYFQNMEF